MMLSCFVIVVRMNIVLIILQKIFINTRGWLQLLTNIFAHLVVNTKYICQQHSLNPTIANLTVSFIKIFSTSHFKQYILSHRRLNKIFHTSHFKAYPFWFAQETQQHHNLTRYRPHHKIYPPLILNQLPPTSQYCSISQSRQDISHIKSLPIFQLNKIATT